LDHLQKLEAVEFIARHVEEITPELDIVFDESHHDDVNSSIDSPLFIDPDGHHIDIIKASSSSSPPLSSSPKKKKETRQIISEILAIALPSLGGMLLDPLMSLIDTACVGQISTTSLAAMAPCTSIFQFAFFAFFFLSAATTNLVASCPTDRVEGAERERRVERNQVVVSNASALAVVLGVLVSGALFQFADPLLGVAGVPASNSALLQAARPYLLIRAVGIPFVFLATVLQGASLGRGNAWRPLRIFGAAGIVNLIGDVYLTLFKGMGATGAAIATVVAQIGAAVYYAVTTSRLDKSVEASSQPKRDVALTGKGFASKSMLQTFASVAITLFSRSIGMMMSFSLLTRAAALSGTAALAAHQVTLQVWWLISFLPEPMSVAAQTLITRDMNERPSRVPKLIKTLYQMSAVLGVSASILTLVALSAPSIVGALVADVSVQKLIASLVPFAVLSQGYCPLATLSDGVCIGLGSFGHLPGIMISSFAATSAALSLVAKYNLGVVGVWGCMNVFLGTRVLGHIFTSTKLRESVRKAFGRRESRFQVDAVAI
jgi:putative MATE family efflux protein